MKLKSLLARLAAVTFFNLVSVMVAVAGPYDSASSRAVTWLIQQRNAEDGSWGTTDDVKYVQTSEAVLALAAMNRHTPEYYAGITWLENHSPANIDFKARRILALQANGNNVSTDLQYLQAAQNLTAPGNLDLTAPGNLGWGLSMIYQGSGLDTALSVQAYNQADGALNINSAVSYLINSQLSGIDSGWAIGQEATSDPSTTAQVIVALIPQQASNSLLPTVIANGLAALNAKVTTASAVPYQALSAIANLRSNGASATAATLLNNLVLTQSADGSWGGNIYATALTVRALAAGMGQDLAALRIPVVVPDVALKRAINQALGRNALDSLNRGELAQLTSLNITGLGISDLTGLQYATNLTSLYAANNRITSTAPLSGLTKLTTVQMGSNPIGPILALSVSNLAFSPQIVGVASVPQTVTLTNTGGSVLNISGMTVSGDFSFATGCGATLAPMANCAIKVSFAPTFMSIRNGVIAVASDATGSTMTVTLTGSGLVARAFDFNGDGKKDILQYNASTGKTDVWLMNGASIPSSVTLFTDPAWQPIGTPDLNGDGKADLIVYNATTGETDAWLMNGATVLSSAMLLTDPNSKVVTTADLNGDGMADLVWYNASTGATSVWLMSGTTRVITATLSSDSNSRVVATADLNGDGKADLIWYNASTGATAASLMNGAAVLSSATLLTDSNWKVVTTAELNGDGMADLIWYNASTGATAAWLMNGATVLSSATLLTDPNWQVVTTADLNGDGKADLIWYKATTGEADAWLMNGATMLSNAMLLTDLNANVIATPDLNGDGKADLVWYNASTGATTAWLMNGTATLSTGVLANDPTPKIIAISPNSGPISGGTAFTITGGNFVSGAIVSIGGNFATNCTVASANSITCTAPAGTAGGQNVTVTETVSGLGSVNATLAGGYNYTNTGITLTAIFPNIGSSGGGTPVTLTGSNFVSAAIVTIRGVPATGCSVVSSTSIMCITPAGTVGAQNVVVTQPGGSATLVGGYYYNLPPRVSITAPANNTNIAASPRVLATVATGTSPIAVAVNPSNNYIYVANSASSNVTVINGDTNTPETKFPSASGNVLTDIAINPATNKVYIANTGAVAGSSSVRVINGNSGGTLANFNIGSVYALAVNSVTNKIYAVKKDSNMVYEIDGYWDVMTLAYATTGSAPAAIAINSATNKIYVANSGTNTVTVFNGGTVINTSTTALTTTTIPVGFFPKGIAVNPITNKIYVTSSANNTVTVIDGVTNAITSIAVGSSPQAIAVNTVTNKIYVANYNSNTVSVINGATNKVTATLPVGTTPRALVIDSDTNSIYVANRGSNTVAVISGNTNAMTKLSTGNSPYTIAANPTTHQVYAVNDLSNTVTVIAGQKNITLSANAADTDGTISKVAFYNGATLLGTVTAAPYNFVWAGAAPGNYTLTAVATDNTGGATTSTAVSIAVY